MFLRWIAPSAIVLLAFGLSLTLWMRVAGVVQLPWPLLGLWALPGLSAGLLLVVRFLAGRVGRGGDLLLLWMLSALAALHTLILLRAARADVSLALMVPMVGALAYLGLGATVSVLERGSALGLRFEATMVSEAVWRRVHRVLGLLFSAGGVATGVTALTMPSWSLAVLVFSPLLALAGAALAASVSPEPEESEDQSPGERPS